MKPLSESSKMLFRMMLDKGYPEKFCTLICSELNTDYTAGRMMGYLSHYTDLPMPEVVDEMLAILSDRDRFIKKKESEIAQSKISHMYRFGLGVDADE